MPPRTLVIDTATAACSVALIAGDAILAETHEVVGRGHAEHLLPMIAALPAGGRAERILVDCGPGSFTGVRVGLAAARALALGWEVAISGYASTAAIAAAAFANDDRDALAVVLEAGHGEVFMQGFTRHPFAASDALAARAPTAALAALDGRLAVGSGLARLRALDPALPGTDMLPRAADARHLPAAFTGLPPSALYGRAPDARTIAERAAR